MSADHKTTPSRVEQPGVALRSFLLNPLKVQEPLIPCKGIHCAAEPKRAVKLK